MTQLPYIEKISNAKNEILPNIVVIAATTFTLFKSLFIRFNYRLMFFLIKPIIPIVLLFPAIYAFGFKAIFGSGLSVKEVWTLWKFIKARDTGFKQHFLFFLTCCL
jgi:hypothetical protein